jgi:para-nitrobenzyl esterase
VPFVFGTLRFTGIAGGAEAVRADRDRLAALSAQMADAWTSFARTGDPNARRTVPRRSSTTRAAPSASSGATPPSTP